MSRSRSAMLGAAALAAALVGTACAGARLGSPEPVVARVPELAEGEPLAGETLAQRKLEMRRAARDLVHFGATAQTMQLRRDRSLDRFRDFMEHFVAQRVDPLLENTADNEDPELAVLDAELRLVKAELLIETQDFWRAGDLIDEVERRYGARGSMLVRFPVGQQSTVTQAIEYLRRRNDGEPGNWVVPASSS